MRLENLELEPGLLWLALFGPGFGESILVVVPDGHWIAIDSLRQLDSSTDVNPALQLLESHEAELSLAALTHPHLDHVVGFADLLDRRIPKTPVGCVDAHFHSEKTWRTDKDASKVRDRSAANSALNRIDEIWRSEPASKWSLRAGDRKRVGELQLEVLHPKAIPARRPRDLNALSTPILMRWHDCRFLLGADLPNSGWKKVEKLYEIHTEFTDAHLLKASHHASDAAQHHLAIGSPPPKDRVCVATPFNRGTRLPSYADEGGIDQLLKTHRQVVLTNAPEIARGTEVARANLKPRKAGFGPMQLDFEPKPASARQAWVAIGFERDGTEVKRYVGDAAGTIVA